MAEKTSNLVNKKIDVDVLKNRLNQASDEFKDESYKINLKSIKSLNWIAWIWGVPVFILAFPFIIGYLLSNYIEGKLKTIFKVFKKLTYALVRDVKNFIKSKFGN
tara:strand:- start:4400 stop:4714 length:315 start_codon:yes stop_codon:yes gene_type:complete